MLWSRALQVNVLTVIGRRQPRTAPEAVRQRMSCELCVGPTGRMADARCRSARKAAAVAYAAHVIGSLYRWVQALINICIHAYMAPSVQVSMERCSPTL